MVQLNKIKLFIGENIGSIALCLLIIYLNIGTGIHSDDYDHIVREHTLDPNYIKNHIIYFPTALYNFSLFALFDKYLILYDIFKILNTLICIYCIYKFMIDYVNRNQALLFSFLFIFYPTHDATNYWLIGQYLMITISLIFISHSLINHNRLFNGFMVGILGAFYSYASPPVNFGLAYIFFTRRQYKKLIIFIIPEILYVIFYYIVTRFYNETASVRDGMFVDTVRFIKYYIVQMLSAVDVFAGPSFFLKIWLSIQQVSILSICIALLCIIVFVRREIPKNIPFNKTLCISFLLIVLFTFGLFSLTGGYYTQIAFNLGDRVTIFGSILMSYFIVSICYKNKKVAVSIFSILLIAIVGISDHWKSWNRMQNQIINRISNSSQLKKIDISKPLFVINNGFSRLGCMDHIEFLSSSGSSVFRFTTGQNYRIVLLSNRLIYKNGSIFDTKFNHKYSINKDYIVVYDTTQDKLLKVEKSEIPDFLAAIDKTQRHWIQLLSRDNYLVQKIITAIPRLEYLF